MKSLIFCLLVVFGFASFSVLFHGCAQEEEAIEEKAPDTEVESQKASEEGIEETEPSSGPKGVKEAKEGTEK
jgi:hypothetical protein